MEESRPRLEDLLEKPTLSIEDKRWLLSYIETDATDSLRELMAEKFSESQLSDSLSNELLQKMLTEVHKKLDIRKREKPVVKSMLLATAVAASLVLIFSLAGINLFKNKEPLAKVLPNVEKLPTKKSLVVSETNFGKLDRRLMLPDGSVVLLSPKSKVSYMKPFVSSREFILEGKARFQVVKSESMSFVVKSGDIATTAIGTNFTVIANSKSQTITIQLHEGKVKVAPFIRFNKVFKETVFLNAGEELVYRQNKTICVKSLNKTRVVNKQNSDNPSLSGDERGNWFMFNNQTLGEVFDQLSFIYQQEIIYEKVNAKNVYFIGKYNKRDSLSKILQRIAKLNDLTIVKSENAFIISPRKD